MVAADAGVDARHLRLAFRRQVLRRGGTPQQQRHPRAGGDIDPRGAGQTIAAAAAEFAGEFLAVLLDQRPKVLVELGFLFLVGEEFVQFAFPLHAPERQHVVKLRQKRISGVGPRNQAAGEAFHGQKPDVLFLTKPDERAFLFPGKVAKRELQRLIQPGFHRFARNGEPELIRSLAPDVLIMATGAKPVIPNIPGIGATGVVQANDVLLGDPVLKSSVLIIGGGEVGVETAEYATDYCTKVSIVEMLPALAEKLYLTVRNDLMDRLKKEEVDVHVNTKVLEFIPGGVVAECNGEKVTLDGYDHVVLALGSKPYVPFDAEGLAPEVYTVGDAVKARDAKWAIYEAYRVAQKI